MEIKYVGSDKKGFINGNYYNVLLAQDFYFDGWCPNELYDKVGVFSYEMMEFRELKEKDLEQGWFTIENNNILKRGR